MSNPINGIGGIMAEAVENARDQLASQRDAGAAAQLDLLDAPSPEDVVCARAELSPTASEIEVINHARARRGRRPGSTNRRTEDFRRFLLSHGRHPALVLMEIANTPQELLIEASRKAGDGKRVLTYGEATGLRARCAEGLLPFVEGKQAAVDRNGDAVAPLIIASVTHTAQQVEDIINAPSIPFADFDEVDP